MLRGYYPRLQRPENVVHFFRDVCGDARITPAVLARRTSSYRRWLESLTEQRGIALLSAPKGVRKQQVLAPYYRSVDADAGVVVILKSMEQSSTFISYEPRHTRPSGDDYRLIKRDSYTGPAALRHRSAPASAPGANSAISGQWPRSNSPAT